MKKIATAKGQEILVDDEDFELVNQWTWRLIGKGYAARSVYDASKPSKRTNQYLHRMILGLSDGDGSVVDHINGSRLDNRRVNLRLCTIRQNGWNSGRRSHNVSGFKGVFLNKRTRKWTANIRVNGKQKYLGQFDSPEDAHAAYCHAAQIHFGEYARSN
ncbi:HNH endonuclease [Ralstonia mannitolilytica]|uniref:HNH endonuclease n=1 Tax=Ralstonia mannitolilytica TaxID=105219 RepID=UPI0039B399C3